MKTAVSQAEIGRLLGLSGARISALKKQGMPVDSLAAAQAWRAQRQNVAARKPLPAGEVASIGAPRLPPFGLDPFANPQSAPGAGGPGDPDEDRDKARTRREIAEADMAEMNAEKLRRELICVDAVKQVLATAYSTAREALMQIASRLSPTVAVETNAVTIQNLLEEEIHRALHKLAEAPQSLDRAEGAFE